MVHELQHGVHITGRPQIGQSDGTARVTPGDIPGVAAELGDYLGDLHPETRHAVPGGWGYETAEAVRVVLLAAALLVRAVGRRATGGVHVVDAGNDGERGNRIHIGVELAAEDVGLVPGERGVTW